MEKNGTVHVLAFSFLACVCVLFTFQPISVHFENIMRCGYGAVRCGVVGAQCSCVCVIFPHYYDVPNKYQIALNNICMNSIFLCVWNGNEAEKEGKSRSEKKEKHKELKVTIESMKGTKSVWQQLQPAITSTMVAHAATEGNQQMRNSICFFLMRWHFISNRAQYAIPKAGANVCRHTNIM